VVNEKPRKAAGAKKEYITTDDTDKTDEEKDKIERVREVSVVSGKISFACLPRCGVDKMKL
jgi:hypothetical protein